MGARYWKDVGRAVFADGRRHPVTLHPHGLDWALYDFADESWMDVAGYQSAHGDNEASLRWIPEGPPSTAGRLRPYRPFITLEPANEGHPPNPLAPPFGAGAGRPPHLLEPLRLADRRRRLRRPWRLGLGRRNRRAVRPRTNRSCSQLARGAEPAG